jgi:hypothetical protein
MIMLCLAMFSSILISIAEFDYVNILSNLRILDWHKWGALICFGIFLWESKTFLPLNSFFSQNPGLAILVVLSSIAGTYWVIGFLIEVLRNAMS